MINIPPASVKIVQSEAKNILSPFYFFLLGLKSFLVGLCFYLVGARCHITTLDDHFRA